MEQIDKLKVSKDDGAQMFFSCNLMTMERNWRKHMVYIVTYWENVKRWRKKECLEYQLENNSIYFHIVQRYGVKEMVIVLKYIK